jgi:hypothetical protein
MATFDAIYKGDPVTIELKYGTGPSGELLENAITQQVRLQRPSGTISYVTGTVFNVSWIRYVLSGANNNESGEWKIQAVADFGDGNVHGATNTLFVKELGDDPSKPL